MEFRVEFGFGGTPCHNGIRDVVASQLELPVFGLEQLHELSTMAKATDRIDRTIEFWRTRRIRKFLLTQKTIELLKTSISALDSQQFTLQHIQALNLVDIRFHGILRH